MAETTTRPRRKATEKAATPAKKAAAKATPAKAASADAPTTALPPTEDGRPRYGVTLEVERETKTYMVFKPPASSGCVGSFYAPLGTDEVKVVIIGRKPEKA